MSSLELSIERTSNKWDALLRVGQSMRYLAIVVIVVLTLGIELVIKGQLNDHPFISQWLVSPAVLSIGFGSIMLLTVTYLIGKERSISRSQRRALGIAMEEESLNLARRYNPVLDFHHPEVCREILTQQASLAARLRAPISVIELSVREMAKNPLSAEWRQFGVELARQVKASSRQTDSMVRWTPQSYLLVLPEVDAEELPVITTRLHNDLEAWFQERFEAHSRPTLQSRGVTTQALGQAGGQVNDILRETQAMLDEQPLRLNPLAQAKRSQARREKSVGLTLPFSIAGIDAKGEQFADRIVTQRVAADCIWFAWSREIETGATLQVTDRDMSICENATLIGFTTREGERIAELRFTKPPSNWVM
jgi:hypothetical protein